MASGAIPKNKGANKVLLTKSTYTNDIGTAISLTDNFSGFNFLIVTVYNNSISSSTRIRFIVPVINGTASAAYYPVIVSGTTTISWIRFEANGTSATIISSSYSTLHLNSIIATS